MKTIDIQKFKGIKAELLYDDIIHRFSERTKNILITTSPKSGRPKRKTPYSTGWVVNQIATKNGYRDVVWNKTNWQLTHLLENGHFISNQRSLGWSAPRKHIKPAYLEVRDPFVEAMKNTKIEVDFK